MFQTSYYVDKGSDPPAAAALAHGVMQVLMGLGEVNEGDIEGTLHDRGTFYEIELSDPVEEAWLTTGPEVRLAFLAAGKQFGNAGHSFTQRYDYEQERANRADYFELRKQMREAKGKESDPEWSERLSHAAPDPDHDFYAKINQLAAIIAYNGLVEQWEENQPHRVAQLRLLLELFAETPNPTGRVAAQWAKQAKAEGWVGKGEAAMLQVVNPSMGKGSNRSKADAVIQPGGLEGFWLVEYLKYLGAYRAMIPRVVSGAKDRKSYVLEPKSLSARRLKQLFEKFQKEMWASTHVKMDILAVLRWMRIFLQEQAPDTGQAWGFGQPDDFVRGLWVTTYKDLGSAVAVINVSLLNIPRWMRAVESGADAKRYFDLVEEHRRVIDTLDEKNSDAFDLLRLYRDFLSGAELRAFFHFCAGYGLHLLQRIDRRQFAQPFTTPNLEELFMAHHDAEKKLKPILEDAGFRNVATAIRQSTIAPQYRKVQGERLYEIRYDLGGRLMQKSRYNDEFVRELSDFMFRYNQENARIAEQGRTGPRRRNLTREDVESVIALVDEYNAPTVAGLLVAYGYARDPKAAQDIPSQDDTTLPTTGDDEQG